MIAPVKTLVMPNGNSIYLEGKPSVDLSGYAGVSGKVDNHYGRLIAGVLLGIVIGAGAQVQWEGQVVEKADGAS